MNGKNMGGKGCLTVRPVGVDDEGFTTNRIVAATLHAAGGLRFEGSDAQGLAQGGEGRCTGHRLVIQRWIESGGLRAALYW